MTSIPRPYPSDIIVWIPMGSYTIYEIVLIYEILTGDAAIVPESGIEIGERLFLSK